MRIVEILHDSFILSYRTSLAAILLDIDDTAYTTNGHQMPCFNVISDDFCFRPMDF